MSIRTVRTIAGLLLAASLTACASAPKPIMIDDGRAPASADDSERRANAALRDIEERIKKGDLPKILFEAGKAAITPESTPTLDLIASILTSDEHLKVQIFAHTDGVGPDEANRELSLRRAKAVGDYLARKGVHPPSIRWRGFGSSKPIADNATEEGRARNRRVEFYITAREWKAVY